jgi:hypothetical protein
VAPPAAALRAGPRPRLVPAAAPAKRLAFPLSLLALLAAREVALRIVTVPSYILPFPSRILVALADGHDEIAFLGPKAKVSEPRQFFTNELIEEINRFQPAKIRAQAKGCQVRSQHGSRHRQGSPSAQCTLTPGVSTVTIAPCPG